MALSANPAHSSLQGHTKPRKNTAIRSSSTVSLYRPGQEMVGMAVRVSEKEGRERWQRMAEMAGPAGTWS